jgi:hypothetical protein
MGNQPRPATGRTRSHDGPKRGSGLLAFIVALVALVPTGIATPAAASSSAPMNRPVFHATKEVAGSTVNLTIISRGNTLFYDLVMTNSHEKPVRGLAIVTNNLDGTSTVQSATSSGGTSHQTFPTNNSSCMDWSCIAARAAAGGVGALMCLLGPEGCVAGGAGGATVGELYCRNSLFPCEPQCRPDETMVSPADGHSDGSYDGAVSSTVDCKVPMHDITLETGIVDGTDGSIQWDTGTTCPSPATSCDDSGSVYNMQPGHCYHGKSHYTGHWNNPDNGLLLNYEGGYDGGNEFCVPDSSKGGNGLSTAVVTDAESLLFSLEQQAVADAEYEVNSLPNPLGFVTPKPVLVAGQASLETYPQVCSNSIPADFVTPQADPSCAAGGSNFRTMASVPSGVTATIDYHYEPCAPVVGSAAGTMTIPGVGFRTYTWYRVGLSAVLLISDGSGNASGDGAAIFAPIPSATVHSCLNSTGTQSALIVGVGATF